MQENTLDKLEIEPREALTGFIELPSLGRIRLDFLITYESEALYIRCLDLGIMSCGESVDECKNNILEAILIYLEDLPEKQSLFKPAAPRYWKMFYELRYHNEERKAISLTQWERQEIQSKLRQAGKVVLQYA